SLDDHRPGNDERHRGRQQRDQRRERRAEHDKQQNDDEDDRERLGGALLLAVLLLLVDRRGEVAAEVDGEALRRVGGGDVVAQSVERLLGRVEANRGLELDEQAPRLAVGRQALVADVEDLLVGRHRATKLVERRVVLGGELAAVAGAEQQRRERVLGLERGGELGGPQAGGVLGQEVGVRALDRA